ncbi:MAG: hypothetical protein WEA75_01020 [Acidimicrobiia bacterium]
MLGVLEVHLQPTVLLLVSSIALPILVGIVTKEVAATWVKRLALALLGVAAAAVTQAINSDGSLDVESLLGQAVLAIAVAQGWYEGPLKPVAQTVQDKTDALGIGVSIGHD